MHRPRVRIGALSVLAFAASAAFAGCFPFSLDCEVTRTCTGLGTGPSGGGGSDGGTPEKCIPSMNGGPVPEGCGVFVSSSGGDDSSAGTKESPVATLAKAVELAKKESGRVYACAEMFEEALVVDGTVEICGGLDCGGAWSYGGGEKKTTLTAGADEIPLRIRSVATGSRVKDFSIIAADAMALGGSSIAAVVEDADVELARCELAAGMGRDGANGETPSEPVGPADPNDPAIKGGAGAAACMGSGSGNLGGAGTINALCNTSLGGSGGTGTEAIGTPGADGQPVPNPNPNNKGLGGAGDTGSGCNSGALGANGATGVPGIGGTDLGTIDASGYAGASGTDGLAGTPGQGGGGGGGAKGKVGCNGASGGGGGAGGCAGKGGSGGKAAGSSIALISLNANVLYKDVVLRTAAGGKGGDGGDGQAGGKGGKGGFGGLGAPDPGATPDACDGGNGGQGGFGGKGGGGRGGHSVGIAYTGAEPLTDGVTTELGSPGLGGAGADVMSKGADGVQATTQEFP